MPNPVTPADNVALAAGHSRRRKVLVTGAAGNIGSYFARQSCEKYSLRLMVHTEASKRELTAAAKCGQVVQGNVTDLESMKEACRGVDTVLHLAADPSPSATWDSLLPSNIVGAYNTMVAAKAAGCRRVIYASSIHAVSGYAPDVQVKESDPVNPGDLYGVTKCFGEALGRYMAEKEGLSVICLRIGAFQPDESAKGAGGVHLLDAFVSQRDLQQLIERCIDVDEIKFGIFAALSDNRFKRMDISAARDLLGYRPRDDAARINEKLSRIGLAEIRRAHSKADPDQKSGIRHDVRPARSK